MKEPGTKVTLSMIVRNEADRYLRRMLTAHLEIIDEAVIIDDGSTDGTADVIREVLADVPLTLIENPVSRFSNEVELRKQQWEETIRTKPDWILNLDADEILEADFAGQIADIVRQQEHHIIYFRLYDMWSETHYREDTYWFVHRTYRPFMVRYLPGVDYIWNEVSQHCGRFPRTVLSFPHLCHNARVQHFGWATLEDRKTKYERYKQLDPDSRFGVKEQYDSILDERPNLVRWQDANEQGAGVMRHEDAREGQRLLVKDIEKVYNAIKDLPQIHSRMAISRSALVHLGRRLTHRTEAYRVLELGSGLSTLFLQELQREKLLELEVLTLEHDAAWVKEMTDRVKDSKGIQVVHSPLKKISDAEREALFADSPGSLAAWPSCGSPVPEALNNDYKIRNAFYAEAHKLPLEPQSIDILIVDGPHGNGRSLAYPLFMHALKSDALVLIDDFDHYPFLEDLRKVFRFEELYRDMWSSNHWTLVQLEGPVNDS